MPSKRHAEQIWQRIDELYANGSTSISKGEMYHWYDTQKIKKTPWRDLMARWAELLEEREEEYVDPQVAETLGGWTLFFSTNPGKLSELAV